MAQPYLDQLQTLVDSLDTGNRVLSCKHFFSGAALYLDQSICGSLTPRGLAFKLPTSRCEELIAAGKAAPLRYFDASPVKRGYVLLPDFRDLSTNVVSSYFDECMAHVSTTGT